MGAFFLCLKEKKRELDMNAIQTTFLKKGFNSPRVFDLGNTELHLYKKQLIDTDNFYFEGDNCIFVVGTIVYKRLGYGETIKQLLLDFMNNSVEYNCLLGNYCVIFYVNKKVHVLNDALNVYELFTDQKGCFITSSFLAASYAFRKLTIDRKAALEKLLTGYIVGKNTLFNEVRRIIPVKYHGRWDIHRWNSVIVPRADRNREKSLVDRTESISDYLKAIESLANKYKPELGLSGGYDSRLLFAAALSTWSFKLDVHTHSTEGVSIHNVEREIVKQIAEKTGSKISIVPTHNLDYYSGEKVESILKDGYYYFDGRCAYNMGAFSPTYTRRYKLDTISDHALTLNGLGGEIYRNYYMNIKPVVSTRQWMKAKIYPDGVDYIVDRETFSSIHQYICTKMKKVLPFHWGKFITAFQIKRYYSEMRMPDCDALNCNANNQMEFYLTPFIEKKITEDAYKSRRFIGISGAFQADMIKIFSPTVASFDSHYGFPFDKKEPLKHRVYMIIRDILPDSIWNLRINRIVLKEYDTNENRLFFERVRDKCSFLHEAAKYTEKLFPEVNFDYLRTDYAMMPNSSYISIVFYMLRDRIVSEG